MKQKSDPWDSQPSCELILPQFASPFPLHLNLLTNHSLKDNP